VKKAINQSTSINQAIKQSMVAVARWISDKGRKIKQGKEGRLKVFHCNRIKESRFAGNT
jgi:hypothetical protein